MRVILLILLLLIISCANKNNKEASIIDENSDILEYDIKAENFTLEKLVSEKLFDYFELLRLQKEHPEFKDAIASQLDDISKDEFVDHTDFSIENVRNVGEILMLSDSTQSMKILYEIVLEEETLTDSIQAFITSKKLILDGEEIKTTKVTFLSVE